jgi:hypothetical protein
MIDLGRGCRRHFPVLLDFVAGGETCPGSASAREHLDRCDRCHAELVATSLTVTALRRLGTDLVTVEPPPDAWGRLLARVERSREAAYRSTWLGRLRLAGGMVSVLLVAVVVWPASTGSAGRSDAPASSYSPAVQEIWQAPAYLQALAEGFLLRHSPSDGEGIVMNYPDGVRPDGKRLSPSMIARPQLKAT